jgi:hypothetical protein
VNEQLFPSLELLISMEVVSYFVMVHYIASVMLFHSVLTCEHKHINPIHTVHLTYLLMELSTVRLSSAIIILLCIL